MKWNYRWILPLCALVCFIPSGSRAYPCACGSTQCCPEPGQIELTFSRTFQGSYRHGEPYDVLTVTPNGSGETLARVGIGLRIQIVCSCGGFPIAGIPPEDMVLFSSGMCNCPGGIAASGPTDPNGWAEFTGTMRAGGCASSLTLFVDGVSVRTVPILVNSPDINAAAPCAVDASDFSAFVTVFAHPERYGICFDYNESGTVDASDLSYFASAFHSACP